MGFGLLAMDMPTRSYAALVALVREQQATITRLERRIRDLESSVAPPTRMAQRRALMARLQEECAPVLTDATAPQARVCRRMEKYRHALFTFVVDPAVPPTNNAAERSLRQLVVSRKISGGTRSAQGTQITLTLASLFTTWRLPGIDRHIACRQMLTSPQL